MQPTFDSNKRKKLSNTLLVIAVLLAAFIIMIIVLGSVTGNDTSQPESIEVEASTPTPYGTEYITPFYTPTQVPTIDPATVNTAVPTADPTPTMVPLSLNALYKQGDSGEEIQIIQNMLIDMGFDPGTADGDFGGSLKSAVMNFQVFDGLDDDGIIGPTTISHIISCWQQMAAKPYAENFPLYGVVIGIDPGHQRNANSAQEPIAPNSTETKNKVSSGTSGVASGLDEYVLNLLVALKLKIELEALGAEVIMTRVANDIDLSNAERAQLMNNAGVDCWIRIHANGSTDESASGMFMLIPDDGCMATTNSKVYSKNQKLAETLLIAVVQTTGAANLGITKRSDLTGFNWSEVPVCLIEMGYMTNEDEDMLLATRAYQEKIVSGLVNGFLEYFYSN